MNRTHVLIGAGLCVAALIATAALYPSLPDRIPIHWNIQGKVDGWGARWTVFLFPVFMLLMLGLMWVLPWLSPKQFQIETFKDTFTYVMVGVIGLFAYLHAVILWSQTAGGRIDVGRPIIAGVFLFLAVLGNVLGKVRRNFWVGVRTPWTLASDRVWNDTHRIAARLFVGAGMAGFLLTFAGVSPVIAFVLMMTAALIPVGYSLYEYKTLERRGEV